MVHPAIGVQDSSEYTIHHLHKDLADINELQVFIRNTEEQIDIKQTFVAFKWAFMPSIRTFPLEILQKMSFLSPSAYRVSQHHLHSSPKSASCSSLTSSLWTFIHLPMTNDGLWACLARAKQLCVYISIDSRRPKLLQYMTATSKLSILIYHTLTDTTVFSMIKRDLSSFLHSFLRRNSPWQHIARARWGVVNWEGFYKSGDDEEDNRKSP